MKRLERKQEKERLERQIHQQMLKEQESLMKELRTMLPEAAESFSSERIVCLCHVVDLWACIVALFEAPTPLSISKLRRLADSDMPLILLSSEIMEKESDFRIIELQGEHHAYKRRIGNQIIRKNVAGKRGVSCGDENAVA